MILFVANRGEIACRIIRSAKKLGFKTAVLYPEIDKDLPFVQMADRSRLVSTDNPRSVYLDFDLIVETAKSFGATHLHPGYGFLSENPDFVEKVEAAGIEFVGPSPQAMRSLGDKIQARNFLKDLDVPLLPAYDGENQDPGFLKDQAEKVGFPLLIKPSAGGGGKGMIRVDRLEDFSSGLESSKRIAKSAFKDDRVFLERYVEKARHIETQVIADKFGEVIVVGERECSIQRRHQKIIEESPCIYLSSKVRELLYENSKKIAKTLKYESLGTVEWLWDGKDQIYFLEVNARLQVEHPVTERVYALDLVEWQLRISLKESLQKFPELKVQGHSIEARLCAEDPQNEFIPSGGKIHRLRLSDKARNDFGYLENNVVSAEFDSMLGKIISFGIDREAAVQNLKEALRETLIFGPITNRAYLLQILEDSRFVSGDIHTQLLAQLSYRFDFVAAAKLLQTKDQNFQMLDAEEDSDWCSPWGASGSTAASEFFWEDFKSYRYFHAPFADWKEKLSSRRALLGGSSEESELEKQIKSPMPGKVVDVLAHAGDVVEKGQTILILEAMKMEHKISSSKKARVKILDLKPGQQVLPDEVLVELEAL